MDASIDKVEDLAREVELNRTKVERIEAENLITDMPQISVVAEPTEYQYGAEAFEAACSEMKQNTQKVVEPNVPKTGKVR